MVAFFKNLTASLHRIVTQPIGELNRAQQNVRYAVDLARHCARALKHDRATEMAAALTYRTIFSMVPMAVVALILIKSFSGVGGTAIMDKEVQENFFRHLGLDIIASSPADNQNAIDDLYAPPPGSGDSVVLSKGKDGSVGVDSALVDEWAVLIAERIDSVSFTSIGVVSVALLIWAALGLAVTVENSFNHIYACPRGRPWVHRITIYWSVLTLTPLLVLISLSLKNQFDATAENFGFLNTVWSMSAGLVALGATWLMLFLLYILMPNTRVRRRPALIGSLVAAILWEIAKAAFREYVTRALPYSALYGSLALIPLFLLWLYLTWLIVLFGFELTYTLQAMSGKRFKYDRGKQQEIVTDPQWLVPIATEIARAFVGGRTIGRQTLAEQLGLPVRSVVQLGESLQQAGLAHQVQVRGEGEAGYTLARPADAITVAELLQIARDMTMRHGSNRAAGWQFLQKLNESIDRESADMTLADVLEQMPEPPAAAEKDDAPAPDSADPIAHPST